MSVISDIGLSRLQASTSFIKQQAQLDAQLANIVKQAAEQAQAIADQNQAERPSNRLVDISV